MAVSVLLRGLCFQLFNYMYFLLIFLILFFNQIAYRKRRTRKVSISLEEPLQKPHTGSTKQHIREHNNLR